MTLTSMVPSSLFQSTLSVRRATRLFHSVVVAAAISIHALRKESDLCTYPRTLSTKFQSTLSVRRATPFNMVTIQMNLIFQSTLSVRRATQERLGDFQSVVISIHALRKESDSNLRNDPANRR